VIVVRTFPPRLPGSRPWAAAIGVFDGVHRGHAAILAETLRRARAIGGRAAVVTFDRHPLATLAPHVAPRCLMTLDQRLARFAALGFGAAVVLPFNCRVASMTAPAFVRRVLAGRLHAAEIVVGWDFHFGLGGTGDGALLTEMGDCLGFRATVMAPVLDRGEPVSSTRIRKLVALGRVAEAARLLGRPLAIEGPVVRGRRLARRLGFPTINIRPTNELLPRFGVYVVRLISGRGRSIPGVANLGLRPTVKPATRAPLLEVHGLVAPPPAPPGRRCSVEFLAFLRPERAFPDLEALTAAIRKDTEAARHHLTAGRRGG
jgi:riboflavin kinase/FMN adenylyltransferase